jgi:hypothetical protein
LRYASDVGNGDFVRCDADNVSILSMEVVYVENTAAR